MTAAETRSAVLSAEFDRLGVAHSVTSVGPESCTVAFEHAHINPVHWPTTTALRWTGHHGWSLVDAATGALLHRLPNSPDADARAVAKTAAELLAGGYDEQPDGEWDDDELENALAGAA